VSSIDEDIRARTRILVDSVCGHVMLPLRPDLRRPFARRSLRERFRVRARFRLARSPSPPIVTLRAFHVERRPALLWTRLPPIDFCNCNVLSDAWARPRAPDSRSSLRAPFIDGFSRARSYFRSRFMSYGPPLTKKHTRAASRDSPSENASTTLQARREIRLRKLPPSLDAACGRRLSPTITCGDGCWTATLDCTGREVSSEGSSSRAPCCRRTRGRRFPSSVFRLLEHP